MNTISIGCKIQHVIFYQYEHPRCTGHLKRYLEKKQTNHVKREEKRKSHQTSCSEFNESNSVAGFM